MTRWLSALLGVVVLVALGVFFWPSSDRTVAPPVAPTPAAQETTPTPAPAPVAREPKPTPAPAPVAREPTPTPAPAPVAQEPTPTPAPAPVSRESTPAPAPVAQEPTPTPAPAHVTEAEAPVPEPAPASTTADTADDAASRANEKATTELSSLQPGFDANALIAALNDSVVNFPSGSAQVPATMAPFLQKAADDLEQLPAGHVLEIAGYTDNTGDSAENVALSQRRADAVRNALIKNGANPEMFVAKGYGSADPIADNDTREGRVSNRRIEYHLIKTP